jgi:hypothetical protein
MLDSDRPYSAQAGARETPALWEQVLDGSAPADPSLAALDRAAAECDRYGELPAVRDAGYVARHARPEACIHPGVFATGKPAEFCSSCGRDIPRAEL